MLDIERIYVGMTGWPWSCPPSPCGAAVNPYMITMKKIIKAKIEIINIPFFIFIVSVLGLINNEYKLFPLFIRIKKGGGDIISDSELVIKYTLMGSDDPYGAVGDITWDDYYFHVKSGDG